VHSRTPDIALPARRRAARRPVRWLALAALAAGLAVPAHAEPPPEGQCPSIAPAGRGGLAEDAIAIPLREGMLLEFKDVYSLLHLLPPEVWRNRHVFFHEGMKLNVGPCHRRYAVPVWYRDATEHYAGKASVDDEGNLEGYVAGLPFPQETIDPEDPQAGARWAWDHVYRWQGAGPQGSFRITDMPSRLGSIETYEGSFFQLQLAHRSDLGESGYRVPAGEGFTWVSGGHFEEPFDARDLSWRQMRPLAVDLRYQEADDTFVYVPTMRKMRRGATAWVDGIYVPRYRVGGTLAGGGVPFGSNQYGPAGSIQPTAGVSAASSEHIRRGFVGMALRPNAYRWRVVKEREVLAPLNGENPGYPVNPDRNFGESGLSLGSDRWDVRWAVVLEGHARDRRNEVQILTLYVDWQTLQPLYYISRQRDRRILDVGIFVHRYSGDIVEYPEWPGGRRALVFDPVAASFYGEIEGGTGWRRESYDVKSLPMDPAKVQSITSTTDLLKLH
jgi:hypothetical protein